jgi:Mlc titration factor MtfA (ptsG expression regulator)
MEFSRGTALMFGWFKKRRRRRILAEAIPDAWYEILERNMSHFTLLSVKEQTKLLCDVQVFVAEKEWDGCDGLEMTDQVKVTIAGQACLLLLGINHDYYPTVQTILIYRTAYIARWERPSWEDGVDEIQSLHRLGEAHYGGPVVLAWDSALCGGGNQGDGTNLVLHEFAHKLDMQDGWIDGTPQLASKDQYKRWSQVMGETYRELCEHVDRGKATLLDEYGATDEAEFFAVATECFFEKPMQMRRRYPELYEVLSGFYNQDVAQRV